MRSKPSPGTALALTETNTSLQDLPNLEGLTTMQSAFVRYYVSAGDGNASAAARAAGYSPEFATQQGHKLVHSAAIQRHMLQLTQQTFAQHAPMAVKTMARLAQGARSEFVMQMAAKDLLDRAGLAAPDKLAIAVKGDINITIDLG